MMIKRKTIENDEEYLRQTSVPVSLEDKSCKKDIELLEQFCKETECFALAAVQIGIPKRIIYIKNTNLDAHIEEMEYNESKVLINPIVLSKKGEAKYWEACLSCLDNMGLVRRPYEMEIQYYDKDGVECKEVFKGFETTVLAHELDHLDGILHIDIADEVLVMTKEERKVFREKNPYEIISKTGEYKGNKKIV